MRRTAPFRFLLLLFVTALASCHTKPVAGPPVPNKPAPEIHRSLPADFVVCIDDSGSISPTEQALVRETTMLLADLAEEGDQVSAIAFGTGARKVAAQLIRTDDDRRAFKDAVRQTLTFKERSSDIRAGLKLLAEDNSPWFRPSGESIRVAIVLSDGKLEPANRDARGARDEMVKLLQGRLSKVDLYSIVLGNRTSQEPIPGLEPITGNQLMKDVIGRSDDRYFQASRLDQLLEDTMLILERAKGSASIDELHSTKLRIDRSVDSMMLVLRKRSTDGSSLCNSLDIRLRMPGIQEPLNSRSTQSGVYWSTDYEYFDLIRIRKPNEGIWEVALANGKKPEVLSKVVSPLDLQFAARSVYYLNEQSELDAWIFDKSTGSISQPKEGPVFRIRAEHGGGPQAGVSSQQPLNFNSETGHYTLELPGALGKNLGMHHFRLAAERLESVGSTKADPWFLRRTGPITVSLAEPFVNWRVTPELATRVPFLTRMLAAWRAPGSLPFADKLWWLPFGGSLPSASFGADWASTAKLAPVFEIPPTVTIELSKLDASKGSFQPLLTEALPSPTAERRYDFTTSLSESGAYRYRYVLNGTTADGPFSIVSPSYSLRVRTGWEYWILLLVALLVVVDVVGKRTAKISGFLQSTAPHPWMTDLTSRSYDSASAVAEAPHLAGAQIVLKATRMLFFFRKRILLTARTGTLEIGREVMDENGAMVAEMIDAPGPGKTIALEPGEYTIRAGSVLLTLSASV